MSSLAGAEPRRKEGEGGEDGREWKSERESERGEMGDEGGTEEKRRAEEKRKGKRELILTLKRASFDQVKGNPRPVRYGTTLTGGVVGS